MESDGQKNKSVCNTQLCGLLIAFDPLSSTALVQTLTRLTWSLKCKWKGCFCRSSYSGKFVPGTLFEAWKREETDMSNYPRIVQLLAFGAGRHSSEPFSASTTQCKERGMGRAGLPKRAAAEVSTSHTFMEPQEVGAEAISPPASHSTPLKSVLYQHIRSKSLLPLQLSPHHGGCALPSIRPL